MYARDVHTWQVGTKCNAKPQLSGTYLSESLTNGTTFSVTKASSRSTMTSCISKPSCRLWEAETLPRLSQEHRRSQHPWISYLYQGSTNYVYYLYIYKYPKDLKVYTLFIAQFTFSLASSHQQNGKELTDLKASVCHIFISLYSLTYIRDWSYCLFESRAFLLCRLSRSPFDTNQDRVKAVSSRVPIYTYPKHTNSISFINKLANMSFLAIPRTARLISRPISALRVYSPCLSQGFHQSSTRNALKESDRRKLNSNTRYRHPTAHISRCDLTNVVLFPHDNNRSRRR